MKEKVLVVTGGGGGIGRELALYWASHGGFVVVNDLGTEPDGAGADVGVAQRTVAEIAAAGGRAVANTDDVSNWSTASRIIEQALDAFGKIDAVVNCAGFMRHHPFEEMPPEDFESVVRTHLFGTFNVSRAAAPHFQRQRSGAYLHMASTTGLIGTLAVTNYGTAKAGIVGLSKLIALDMARYGVRSNCMAPSARSRQWERINAMRQARYADENNPGAQNVDDPASFKRFRSTQGTAAQIAPVAAFWSPMPLPESMDRSSVCAATRSICTASRARSVRSIDRRDGRRTH